MHDCYVAVGFDFWFVSLTRCGRRLNVNKTPASTITHHRINKGIVLITLKYQDNSSTQSPDAPVMSDGEWTTSRGY